MAHPRVRVSTFGHLLELFCPSFLQTYFLDCNAHCRSYTWKAFVGGRFITLDPGRTLGDNGVSDDTAEAAALGLDPDLAGYQTTLLLVYNDDLTTA